MLLNDLQQLLL